MIALILSLVAALASLMLAWAAIWFILTAFAVLALACQFAFDSVVAAIRKRWR